MDIDLTDPQLIANPHPFYAEWRKHGPVIRHDAMGWWMVTDHAEVDQVYRAPSVYSSAATKYFGAAGESMAANTMASADQPDHTRLRRAANRVFTPYAVAALESTMHEIIDDALAGKDRGSPLDIVNDLAYPLASTVIAQLLGVPKEDRDRFRAWADDISRATDFQVDPDVMAQARRGIDDLRAYLVEQIDLRRAHPTEEDLIGRLVSLNRDAVLSDDELLGTCLMLLVAGYETTVSLIGNAALALIENPGERKRLADDLSLMDSAIEEFLRYAGPVQVGLRVALSDTTLANADIKAGDIVMTLPACANRDPRHYHDPETFDVTRGPRDHHAFGFGIHVCLGAPLARLETKVAFTRLLAQFPEYELATPADELVYHATFVGRRLTALPVVL